MKITVQIPSRAPKGDLVHFVVQDELSQLPSGIHKEEFTGGYLTYVLTRDETRRALFIGVGKREDLRADRIRKAAATASRLLASKGCADLVLAMEEIPQYTASAVDGAVTGAYKFEDFLPKARQRKTTLEQVTVLVKPADQAQAKKDAAAGGTVAGAVNYTRQIGNLPPNVINPMAVAAEAKKLAKENGLACKVISGAALSKGKFGGLLAVGGGSSNEPCLIELAYQGAGAKAPALVVVGKAITFDSGGISLKPGADMDEMKFDKMGGIAVLGILKAISALKLKVNVTGVIAAAENLPGPDAYRPGDIVTTYDGQTVEILNTDAEGRMVLADALSYSLKHLKPAAMIDLATLTGACVVALGPHRSGVFTRDAALQTALSESGEETGDRVWPLPVGEEYDEDVRSDIAVVKNTGGRWGGACTAASFLKFWTGGIPWAHLDIAGTAWLSAPKAWAEKGATGVGVRLLTEYAKGFGASNTRK